MILIFQDDEYHDRGRIGCSGSMEEHWIVPELGVNRKPSWGWRHVECIVVSLPRKYQQMRRQIIIGRENEVSKGWYTKGPGGLGKTPSSPPKKDVACRMPVILYKYDRKAPRKKG